MYLANNEILKKIRSYDESKITADHRASYESGIAQDGQDNNRVLTVADNVAMVNISGMLTKSYTLMTWWYGGTAYSDISKAFALAENDPEIERIVINMDSGGGQVSGLFDLIAQMQVMNTPTSCYVSGCCCSAAYAIASQCNEIVAASDGEMIGSIGVVLDTYVLPEEVSVSSSNAPNKRPDLSTESGRDVVRGELDEYEELFLEAVAAGRNKDIEYVVENFGQGGTMIARNALTVGMIDSIQSNLSGGQGGSDQNITANNEVKSMDIAELKANHPDLYAQVLAEGKEQGKADERERAAVFLELGAASGAGDLAMDCIKNGSEHSATMTAKFEAAKMAKNTLQASVDDNVDTDEVDVSAKGKEKDIDDLTLEALNDNGLEMFE